ncbi:reverse transcriptase, partial [Striga asiatica]
MLLINFDSQSVRRKSRFRFDKRWLTKEGVKEVIEEAWTKPTEGTPMFKVKEKIKATRIALLSWISLQSGRNSQILGYPWIKTLNFQRIAFKEETHTTCSWVHELLDPNGREWNSELVNSLFEADVAEAILKLNHLNPAKQDGWLWQNASKGPFS